MFKTLVVLALICAVVLAQGTGIANNHSGRRQQRGAKDDREAAASSTNPANWHGTWTANNRYGGVMYACPKGNRLYGVYSNAGFFIGSITDRMVDGTWYEGGRGDRNDWQGAFRIEISEDNQEFDGYYYRVTEDGAERRWHEYRLGAPYPSNPTDLDCLVPANENLLGSFYRQPSTGVAAGTYSLCKDQWDQIYGSFSDPDGYIEGWSVDASSGFHGYRYDSTGRSGAYILRAVSDSEVRGFYWRGRLARQNIETATLEVLQRTSYTARLNDCEAVGPGFLERLRGPDKNTDDDDSDDDSNSDDDSGVSTLSVSIALVVISVLATLLF